MYKSLMKKINRAWIFFFLAPVCAAAAWAADYSAILYKTAGDVTFQTPAGPSWKKTRIGMGLSQNDRIRTGPGAHAQILLDDGSFYVIREKCEVEIEELAANRKTREQQSVLKLSRGTLLGRIQKLAGGSKAHFKSPTALVAVRGTELAMEVEEDATTHVALYEGRIVVTDFAEERFVPREQDELLMEILHEVSLRANQATTISKTGIAKPKKISGKMKEWEKEFPALRAESEKARSEQSGQSYDEAQSSRERARQEALQAP